MSAMLRHAGYNVESTTSPADAVRWVHNGVAPELLLTGYIFCGTDGLELTRQIRVALPGLPVLMATTGAEQCSVDLAREGLHVLPKPFPSAALRNAIDEALLKPQAV